MHRTILLAAAATAAAITPMAFAQKAPALPRPDTSHDVVNYPVVTGWPEDVKPVAPAGFDVIEFARSLDSPRQLLVLANGDVLVSEAKTVYKTGSDKEANKIRGQAQVLAAGTSANRITLLRDTDGDGRADSRNILVENLNQPFGMAAVGGKLYVANTDGLVSFPFEPGATRIDAKPTTLMALPAGGYNNHWTRNLRLSRDGRTLYVSVGSASNVAEQGMDVEKGRAAIHAFDIATGRSRIYASGLRNPVGMDIAADGTLWTAVNERDNIGDDLVPDYIVGVRDGGFYGWPYSYFGQNQDPRRAGEAPDLVAKAIVPDLAVGAHVAALGFAFAPDRFPAAWRGAFVARHGSWNRSDYSGYDVAFVPMAGGKPTGEARPFLTGFIQNRKDGLVNGRPVSLQTTAKGELLVTDDAGGRIWLVRPSSR